MLPILGASPEERHARRGGEGLPGGVEPYLLIHPATSAITASETWPAFS
jgi:hypothetical protein